MGLSHHLIAVLTFLLTLVFVSSILRARRAAGSTLAWLLLICVVPYAGIPLYLIFSSRKFKLRRNKRIYKNASVSGALPELTPIQRILRASGVPDTKANAEIEILPTGVVAYQRILKLVSEARESVHLTTFIFANDAVGKIMVEELTKKAAAGVDVRVLVDSLGATLIGHPSFRAFVRAGGKIAYFMPLLHIPFRGRSNLRNHRKMMIVDGQNAVLGGMNLAEEYMGPSEDEKRWIDVGLQIAGECVTDIHEIFIQDWNYATHEQLTSTAHPAKKGKLAAQVVASGPDVSDDCLYDVLLSAINDAKSCIRIVTPYFIPDESLTKALELAAKRGVEVQIIIPRRSNHRLADLARGSFVRQLQKVGVQFRIYPRMIHAKVLMIDKALAILGSANFDMRSLLLNYEIGLVIYSQETLTEVEAWVSARNSETVPMRAKKTGFIRELGDGVGRLIGPLL